MGTIIIYPVEAERECPCLISLINALQKESNRNITVVVPENATLEYEQSLLRNESGILGVSIKSMEKIQSTILENYGYGNAYKNRTPVIATRGGMIAKTFLRMNELSDQLKFCKNVRISSAEKMYDTIEDIKMHGYGKEELEKLSSVPSIPPLLRDKFHDVCLIMSNDEIEKDKAIALDASDLFTISCKSIEKMGVYASDNIIFCGFDVFTSKMLSFCKSLLLNSNRKVHMVFVKPDEETRNSQNTVFAELENSINNARKKIKKDKEANISIVVDREYGKSLKPEIFDPTIRYLSSEILGLRESVPANMNSIKIYIAPNQYTECLHAAQQILHWHEEGCSWKNMGIVMYSLLQYGRKRGCLRGGGKERTSFPPRAAACSPKSGYSTTDNLKLRGRRE